jgi:uncharacterized protein (DUF924 family)
MIERWKKDAKAVSLHGRGHLRPPPADPCAHGVVRHAWIVRRFGRRCARNQELALEQAIAVIRAFAKDAGLKIAASAHGD